MQQLWIAGRADLYLQAHQRLLATNRSQLPGVLTWPLTDLRSRVVQPNQSRTFSRHSEGRLCLQSIGCTFSCVKPAPEGVDKGGIRKDYA